SQSPCLSAMRSMECLLFGVMVSTPPIGLCSRERGRKSRMGIILLASSASRKSDCAAVWGRRLRFFRIPSLAGRTTDYLAGTGFDDPRSHKAERLPDFRSGRGKARRRRRQWRGGAGQGAPAFPVEREAAHPVIRAGASTVAV